MYLAYREEFDSPTMNELRSADCHSYVDDCSTAKAPHLERLPLWKTHDTNKGLWINAPQLLTMVADNSTCPGIHLLPMRCYTQLVRFNLF